MTAQDSRPAAGAAPGEASDNGGRWQVSALRAALLHTLRAAGSEGRGQREQRSVGATSFEGSEQQAGRAVGLEAGTHQPATMMLRCGMKRCQHSDTAALELV